MNDAPDETREVLFRPTSASQFHPLLRRGNTTSLPRITSVRPIVPAPLPQKPRVWRVGAVFAALVVIIVLLFVQVTSFQPALARQLSKWGASNLGIDLPTPTPVPVPSFATGSVPVLPGAQPNQPINPGGYPTAGTLNVVTADPNSNQGPVNPLDWGANAPDRYLHWAGNTSFEQMIRASGITLLRVGAIQYYVAAHPGQAMCSSPTNCDFSVMDSVLKTIFDAGAQPEFIVTGYPGGIGQYDWADYATFMKMVVTRYNVNLTLGHRIQYWEMWNEPSNEPDGIIPTPQLYASYVNQVAGAMKAVDPNITILGPTASFADLGTNGWLYYMSKNTGDLLDVLSYHNYGSIYDNETARLQNIRGNYYDQVRAAQGSFVSPSGRIYNLALTEYNMVGQWFPNNQELHSSYDAVYTASSIMDAMKAHVEQFMFYLTAQESSNLLGFMDPGNNYAPYRPYFTFYLFGNLFKGHLLATTGDYSNTIDAIASRSGNTITVIVSNKDLQKGEPFQLKLGAGVTGSYKAYVVDNNNTPETNVGAGTLQGGALNYTLTPTSVTAFVITLG